MFQELVLSVPNLAPTLFIVRKMILAIHIEKTSLIVN